MEQIDVNGTIYGVAVAYGIMSELEGAVYELMPEGFFDKLQTQAKQGGNIDNIEQDARDALTGADLKGYLLGNSKQKPLMIAKILRMIDGETLIEVELKLKKGTKVLKYDLNDEIDRLRYVEQQLSAEDGAELAEYVDGLLKKIQQGRDQKGKSTPSSEGAVMAHLQ